MEASSDAARASSAGVSVAGAEDGVADDDPPFADVASAGGVLAGVALGRVDADFRWSGARWPGRELLPRARLAMVGDGPPDRFERASHRRVDRARPTPRRRQRERIPPSLFGRPFTIAAARLDRLS
jgi:hypothetical protein